MSRQIQIQIQKLKHGFFSNGILGSKKIRFSRLTISIWLEVLKWDKQKYRIFGKFYTVNGHFSEFVSRFGKKY